MSVCGFSERSPGRRVGAVVQRPERGSGNVCNDQGEEVGVSSLGTEIVPVFRTHSQRALFAEAWHALQGEGGEFSDLEEEDV